MIRKILVLFLIVFSTTAYGLTRSFDFFQDNPPVLSNFRIDSSEPNKIYFDSTEPISGSNHSGFELRDTDGLSISGVSISSGQTSGHYFLVSGSFQYYHNNTIRYTGGSDIQSNFALQPFDLQYIKNYIPNPTPNGEEYYVSPSGNNNNNGLSEDNAFSSIQKALNTVDPGDKVWIKAGVYNERLNMPGGTSSNPIWVEGYKSTPGDITANYYEPYSGPNDTSSADFDTSEMPTLDGENRSSSGGTGINLLEVGHIFIKNLQIRNYSHGIEARNNTHTVYENINLRGFGNTSHVGGIGLKFNTWQAVNKYNRFLNITTLNASAGNFYMTGNNCLVENMNSYGDEFDPNNIHGISTDYYFQIQGDNSIVRNSVCDKRMGGRAHDGHSFGTKYNAEYNLLEFNTSINIHDSFMVRHHKSRYNVFRDSEAHANVSYKAAGWTGGVAVLAGGSYNTWDRMYIHHVKFGFYMVENTEDPDVVEVSIGNTFKNFVIDNVEIGMRIRNEESPTGQFRDNKFYNITWNNVKSIIEIWDDGPISFSGNEIVNNTFTNVPNLKTPVWSGGTQFLDPSGFEWKNNNFYNSFPAVGDNALSVDPNFVNGPGANFRLNPESELIGAGQVLAQVNSDFDNNLRLQHGSFDIGAFQDQSNIPNVSSDVTICAGEETVLIASGGDSYLWENGEETSSITVNPEVTTTYAVDVINSSGTTNFTVTVSIIDAATAAISEDVEICEGSFVDLTASGGDNYLWSNGETTETISVNPEVTTTYTVSVTNEGCSSPSEASVIVTVIDMPELSAGEDVEICGGGSVTLTASGSDNYLWDNGETTETITVSPSETTTYQVTTTVGDCSITEEVTVVVSEEVAISVSEDKTICLGSSTRLRAVTDGDVVWSTGETTKRIRVSPEVTTTYTVTVSNSCGEDVTETVTVIVSDAPELALTEDLTVCEGDDVTLVATTGGTVLWSTGETTASITVSPDDTTIYNVVATLGDCTIEKQVEVTVALSGSLSAGPNQSICAGSEVTLVAEGDANFSWSTGEEGRVITVSPTTTTTYTVSAITPCGSVISDEVIVFVDEIPTINAGPDVEICKNSSVVLTATTADNYLWSNGKTTQSITVSPNNTTAYTVKTSNRDCFAEDEVIVEVKEVTVNAGDDVTIDEGSSTTLTATGNGTYQWNTGETTASINVDPTETTTYTVTITSSEGCTNNDDVIVTVTPTPADPPVDDPPADDPPADDPPVDDPPADDPPVDDPPVDDPPVDDPPVDDPPVDDTPVDNSYGFAGQDQTICKDASVVLTASLGSVFLWSTGEVTASITVSPSETTTYNVTVREGTEVYSDEVVVTIDEDCSGLGNRSGAKSVLIFPNPASDIVNIELIGFSDQLDIDMFNLNGSKVYSEKVAKYSPVKKLVRTIDVSRFSKGIYFIRLTNRGEVAKTKKILII